MRVRFFALFDQVVMPAGQSAQPPERLVVVDRGGEAAVLSLYSVSATTASTTRTDRQTHKHTQSAHSEHKQATQAGRGKAWQGKATQRRDPPPSPFPTLRDRFSGMGSRECPLLIDDGTSLPPKRKGRRR